MKFVVTIDTEEDNWARYSSTDNPVENIKRLIKLQDIFDKYDVKPTYLITYPVATNKSSIAILKTLLDRGNCEIGTHCHPWNTPPFCENAVITDKETMLCNLNEQLVLEKISILHQTIIENIGIIPISFRAGRWGFGPAVAKALCDLGYKVDTSVCAYTDWRPYHGPDQTHFAPELFRFGREGVHHRLSDGQVLEIPVTVGFLQKNFNFCQRFNKALENTVGKKLRLKGIFDKLKILNKICLSPELSSSESMNSLMDNMLKCKYYYLNYTFHSSSLLPGLSPFVQSEEDEKNFMKSIKNTLDFIKTKGFESISLSQMISGQSVD